jgi:hypothetical protein
MPAWFSLRFPKIVVLWGLATVVTALPLGLVPHLAMAVALVAGVPVVGMALWLYRDGVPVVHLAPGIDGPSAKPLFGVLGIVGGIAMGGLFLRGLFVPSKYPLEWACLCWNARRLVILAINSAGVATLVGCEFYAWNLILAGGVLVRDWVVQRRRP